MPVGRRSARTSGWLPDVPPGYLGSAMSSTGRTKIIIAAMAAGRAAHLGHGQVAPAAVPSPARCMSLPRRRSMVRFTEANGG
jgi:hypothetical protein